MNPWSCFCREMKRKEEEESKTTALTDEDDMEEDEEEEEAPTEAGACGGGDDKDEGSAADEDDGDDDDASEEEKSLKKTEEDKRCVPGIIYLGHIPPRLRPKHLRNLLSVYGEIGRIFLQPEGNTTISIHYTTHDPRLLPQREPSAVSAAFLLVDSSLCLQTASCGERRRSPARGSATSPKGGWSFETNAWPREWRRRFTTRRWAPGNANASSLTSGPSRYILPGDS